MESAITLNFMLTIEVIKNRFAYYERNFKKKKTSFYRDLSCSL